MANFIKATYHTNLQVAEFITDDGRHLLRAGGTLPWRINNGGDLASPLENGKPAPKKTKNYIGFAQVPSKASGEYHFFIFPDYETGRAELCASLKRKHGERCIPEVIEKYAPSRDNNTKKYIDDLLKVTNIDKDKKVKDFSDEELAAMADGIERIEGYHNNADTRKEIWVPVSTIVATDGARPLADEEIVLKIDGKETTIKSNSVGQFPPIPHAGKPIEVIRNTSDGKQQKIAEIHGDKGKDYSLVNEVKRFFGMTRPEKAPEGTTQSRHQALTYQVQPKDTLSKIAAKFNTTVDKIKSDNGLRNDKIFPGEILGINGAPPSKRPARAIPQKAPPKPKPPAESATSIKPKAAPPADTATIPVRSKEGTGAPLALLPTENKRAPWMAYAVAEAKQFKGMDEKEIEKSRNYATEVKTGQQTIIGNNHPWCAAFVNWCLMQAGYPIENPDFYDKVAAKGRAHGFYEVKGKKENKTDKDAAMVRNPLYVEIDKPIFGAIAMVTNAGGHGHHVGFVYAKSKNGFDAILLGGNQKNQINFSPFSIDRRSFKRTKLDNGKKVEVTKWTESLKFFVPTSYLKQAGLDEKLSDLGTAEASDLNKQFGIVLAEKEGSDTL